MCSATFRLLFLTLGVLMPGSSLAQQDTVYTVSQVNAKPQPIAGMNNFYDEWSKKVVYPEQAIRGKVQGLVFIQFIVNEDGTITDERVRSGIGHGCDEAALKGFSEVKSVWKPGIKRDQPVKVNMVIPFSFRLIEKK